MLALYVRSARFFGLVCVLSALAFTSTALGQTDPAIHDFFLRVDRAVASMAAKTGASANSACLGFVRALLDVDSLARRAVGGVWNRMTPRQQADFHLAVERRAARECVVHNRTNRGAPVVFVGVRQGSGGDQLLATRVEQEGGAGRAVVWRLHPGGARQNLRAIDLLVDGRSTAITLRDEASGILDRTNGSIDALIAQIGR